MAYNTTLSVCFTTRKIRVKILRRPLRITIHIFRLFLLTCVHMYLCIYLAHTHSNKQLGVRVGRQQILIQQTAELLHNEVFDSVVLRST
jgi:hypothetical protein